MWYRVFSTGHAGSTWLSTVLHHPHRGAPAFHEPMPVLLPREFRTQCGFDDLTDPEARASFLAHVEPYLAWWRRRIHHGREVRHLVCFTGLKCVDMSHERFDENELLGGLGGLGFR